MEKGLKRLLELEYWDASRELDLLDCTHELSTIKLPKQGLNDDNVSQNANM